MIDVVMPSKKSDEVQFRDMAKVLGYKEVIFLSSDKKSDIILAEVKQISSLKKNKIVFAKGSRAALEPGAHILFDFEIEKREDFLHHRASGLNQVLCKIAKKRGSIIAFNFNSILEADDVFRAKIIGRMKQNIRLCRKYKIPMLALSFAKNPFQMRNYFDMKIFFIDLGMHPKEFIEGQKRFKDLLDKLRKKGFE